MNLFKYILLGLFSFATAGCSTKISDKGETQTQQNNPNPQSTQPPQDPNPQGTQPTQDPTSLATFQREIFEIIEKLRKTDKLRSSDKQIWHFDKQSYIKNNGVIKYRFDETPLLLEQNQLEKEYFKQFLPNENKDPWIFYVFNPYKKGDNRNNRDNIENFFRNHLKYLSPINFKSTLQPYAHGEYELQMELLKKLGTKEEDLLQSAPTPTEMFKNLDENDIWSRQFIPTPLRVSRTPFGYTNDEYNMQIAPKKCYAIFSSNFNLNSKETTHYKRLYGTSISERWQNIINYDHLLYGQVLTIALEKFEEELKDNPNLEKLYIPLSTLKGAFANCLDLLSYSNKRLSNYDKISKNEYNKFLFEKSFEKILPKFLTEVNTLLKQHKNKKIILNIFDRDNILENAFNTFKSFDTINFYDNPDINEDYKAGLNVIHSHSQKPKDEKGDIYMKKNHIKNYYDDKTLVVTNISADPSAKAHNGGFGDITSECRKLGVGNYAIILPLADRYTEGYRKKDQLKLVT